MKPNFRILSPSKTEFLSSTQLQLIFPLCSEATPAPVYVLAKKYNDQINSDVGGIRKMLERNPNCNISPECPSKTKTIHSHGPFGPLDLEVQYLW